MASSHVLVLIDGHSHPFLNKQLNYGKMSAATLLREAVDEFLPTVSHVPSEYRLVVRIYADLASLNYGAGANSPPTVDASSSIASRPLASFAAEFSCPEPFFDFTDVGSREAVESKIEGMYAVAVQDPACKHILLGAWEKPTYISMLQLHRENAAKVTLIETNRMGPGVSLLLSERHLPYTTATFPNVFRRPSQKDRATAHHAGIESAEETMKIKQETGSLRLDIRSIFSELFATTTAPQPLPAARQPTQVDNPPRFRLPPQANPGYVPVNKNGERLDVYMRQPTKEQFAAYQRRVAQTGKPCNEFYLHPPCENENCPYDHSPTDGDIRYVHIWIVKSTPCTDGSRCRRANCSFGHVCQKHGCRKNVDKARECNMKDFHAVDPVYVEWVPEDAGYAMKAS